MLVRIWEKVIVLKQPMSSEKMVEFALKYRTREQCQITARDDINDAGERHDIVFMRPYDTDSEKSKQREQQIAKAMYNMFDIETYHSIFLSNSIGCVIVHPMQIKIGANEWDDKPPEQMVQSVLDILPADNIAKIRDDSKELDL